MLFCSVIRHMEGLVWGIYLRQWSPTRSICIPRGHFSWGCIGLHFKASGRWSLSALEEVNGVELTPQIDHLEIRRYAVRSLIYRGYTSKTNSSFTLPPQKPRHFILSLFSQIFVRLNLHISSLSVLSSILLFLELAFLYQLSLEICSLIPTLLFSSVLPSPHSPPRHPQATVSFLHLRSYCIYGQTD